MQLYYPLFSSVTDDEDNDEDDFNCIKKTHTINYYFLAQYLIFAISQVFEKQSMKQNPTMLKCLAYFLKMI
ncbi:hypothetical protein BpHYR1_007496 [Brachionus plicatilis]|uniref:Uncharacterized protein n=1 Tax=Brachionus plicatilis TaxID=10195 RepID=A0A3M7REY5_BRAPC|nr:hypothetical protein BpHYR1_007496 [Brachionus plicatilis]